MVRQKTANLKTAVTSVNGQKTKIFNRKLIRRSVMLDLMPFFMFSGRRPNKFDVSHSMGEFCNLFWAFDQVYVNPLGSFRCHFC